MIKIVVIHLQNVDFTFPNVDQYLNIQQNSKISLALPNGMWYYESCLRLTP